MTTRRTAKSVPAVSADAVVTATEETAPPAPKSVRPARRRPAAKTAEAATEAAPVVKATSRKPRPAAKVPAIVTDVTPDVAISKAAPTLLGADGTMIRHTQDYTVDLLNPGEDSERDFSKMLAKGPSETHVSFVEWVKEQMDEDIDARTVQILISTYHEFQRSPGQKAKMIARRLAAASAKAEKVRATKAKKALAAKK